MSTCSWIWYLVYMICNIWTCWHDMIHVSKRDNHVNIILFHVWMIGIMLTQLSCTRSCLQILYRGWSYREYMMDIMETWLMSTISSIHILYHADVTLSLSHVTHIMDTWYRDIMCRYEGRAELCVCVRTTQLAAHVSVSSTLQGHNLMSHDHIFGSESHTNVRNHEAVGDLLLVYLHFWAWTQVSVYRDWVKLPRSYFSISLYKVYQDKISTNSETMSSLK